MAIAGMVLASCATSNAVDDDDLARTTTAVTTSPQEANADQEPEFFGHLDISPASGPIGTAVTVTGSGFDANADLVLAWEDTTASWNVDPIEGKFFGREFSTEARPIANVSTDATGAFEVQFEIPNDFGFTHNVTIHQGDTILNRAAFRTEMQMSISPTSGPVGTPITIEVNGMGYGYLENSWQLTYDNSYTGWVSAVTTDGSATATITAVGRPGTHIIQLTHGWSHVPYLNNQQSPRPDRPVFTFEFTVTDDPPVLPMPAHLQGMPLTKGSPPADDGKAAIWSDVISGPVGTPIVLSGHNLPSEPLSFVWYRQEGNRVSGSGWSEIGVDLGTATPGTDGSMAFGFEVPDDLGGPHRIEAMVGDVIVATTSFDIKPSALAVENGTGPAGTMALFHVKGVGWTETANIYTVVYDNSYVGFACGFNSQGDIQIYLPLTGEPGFHYVDFYPAIYRGEDVKGAVNFRLPQLTYANDHPGEELPAFHFVVEVTES
ncbi:MAG: hypothetical protein OEM32_07515 [Acidimicrobiia bacterium]|nr:hypothetical protein [Acidimicrobiia bacterium]